MTRAGWAVGLRSVLVALAASGAAHALPAAVPSPAETPASATSAAAEEASTEVDVSAAWDAAVAAYRDGRYADAAARFAALLEHEGDRARRATLHRNAGTAAARADELGVAVWHLEAARRLAPRDEGAAANLRLVRARLGQGESEAEHFTQTLARMPLLLTPRERDVLVAALAGLGLLSIALRRARVRGAPPIGVAVALGFAAVGWHLADAAAREADLARAIVVADAAALRAEPEAEARVLYRAAEGTRVSVDEDRGEWSLVETSAGARGWTRADQVRAAGT